jgi:5-hydroxyisourate hydrolase
MSGITTHVLDTARGRPAAGVPVTLEARGEGGGWVKLAHGRTDADGRLRDLLPADFALSEGDYRLTFDAGAYFAAQGAEGFYAEVAVAFVVRDAAAHYHVPLLLSPYGYSTYRGS